MTNAVAGHGATIAIELDPDVSPGVFTVIAELNGDINWPELSRGESEVSPHQDTIDSWVLGIMRRGALTFSVNYIFNNNTHDHLTGLYKKIQDNETFGVRLRGPQGAADTDEWILSGAVQAISKTDPVREGARTSDVTIRPSGAMIIDGVAFGTAG